MFRLVVLTALFALAFARVPLGRWPKLDGKIVGGKETTIEDHPYQLSIQLNNFGHWCGASLIREDVVLTAAHCTEGFSASNFKVRAGSSRHNTGGKTVNVVSICDHPKYYPYDYDVSVLHLETPLTLSAGIQLITLQSANEEVPTGAVATVTGWGALSSGGGSPVTLQEVNVPKISDANCTAAYPGSITKRMNCYGYPEGEKDACQGDSGGPLVVNGKQTGIVSWGRGCAFPNYPGVYSKVADQEITDHINSCIAKFQG